MFFAIFTRWEKFSLQAWEISAFLYFSNNSQTVRKRREDIIPLQTARQTKKGERFMKKFAVVGIVAAAVAAVAGFVYKYNNR